MKLLFKAIRFLFSGYITFIASLASIAGLIIAILNKTYAVFIALGILILFLSIVLLKFFSVVNRFLLQKTENGFHKFANYVRYSTNDGKHISYVLQKYIQAKVLMINEHVHKFHWSGTCEPIITSSLQEFVAFNRTPKGEYDEVILRFKTPLTYNDFAIVHIKMELDDSDNKSEPYCEQAVKEPLQLLDFRIELRHLEQNPDAKILKKKLGAPFSEYEILGYVKFDINSRCYEHSEFNPHVGYSYRIEWNKV